MIATLLSYVVIALTCGVLGLLLAGWLAAACVSWYRISSFEGKAGYFVVFTALLGAIVAMGIALITTGVVASTGSPWFLRSMAFSLGLVVSAAAGAAMACRLLADIPPTIDGCELDLEVEVRQPAGETVGPAGAAWSFWLGSVVRRVQRASRRGELKLADSRCEGGRWIIPGSVKLFTRRGRRLIALERDGQILAGFLVPLPARPGRKFEQWSDWKPQARDVNRPWPDSKPSYRFRVVRQGSASGGEGQQESIA